jgi:TatD DNase family protein
LKLWDTHAHLTDKRFASDWRRVVDEAFEAGVYGAINIGIDPITSREAMRQADHLPDRMRVTVGLHPHEASRFSPEMMNDIEALARRDLVVAVGEIGLDYHYMRSKRADQLEAFHAQVGIATSLDLPVVIHSRDAENEVVDHLEGMAGELCGGVLHCYTGGIDVAGKVLDLGFYISFTGIVTFGDRAYDDLVRYVPLDRLLLETDSPYLAPVPYRGKTNTPAYLPAIASRVAELKEIGYEDLVSAASRNASDLFGLP